MSSRSTTAQYIKVLEWKGEHRTLIPCQVFDHNYSSFIVITIIILFLLLLLSLIITTTLTIIKNIHIMALLLLLLSPPSLLYSIFYLLLHNNQAESGIPIAVCMLVVPPRRIIRAVIWHGRHRTAARDRVSIKQRLLRWPCHEVASFHCLRLVEERVLLWFGVSTLSIPEHMQPYCWWTAANARWWQKYNIYTWRG